MNIFEGIKVITVSSETELKADLTNEEFVKLQKFLTSIISIPLWNLLGLWSTSSSEYAGLFVCSGYDYPIYNYNGFHLHSFAMDINGKIILVASDRYENYIKFQF